MPTNRLTWSASTPGDAPIAGYRLYDADTNSLIAETGPATLTYETESLPVGVYRYYVRAYATDGQVSVSSNIVTLTIAEDVMPGAVTLTGELVDGDVELAWTASVGGTYPISEYEVYRSVNGGAFALLTTISAPTLIHTDSTVSAPNVYAYRVVAIDSHDNESDDSNVVEIDSSFDEVVVLLQAHTGTLVEVSGLPEVIITGAGAVSTVQAKFGTASFRNPGTAAENSNFVRLRDASDNQGLFIFTGEFTIEGWFYVVAAHQSFDNFFASIINFPFTGFIQLAVSSSMLFWNASPGGIISTDDVVPIGSWCFVAVTRNASNTLTLWLNGENAGSLSVIGTMGGFTLLRSSLDVCRGQAADNGDLDCYFDQIRMTKRCRYTAPFTPPTEPFPSGG